eukprot:CAMPEP_0204113496 /NCGR_PEP_ID=MMETSP0361-20130328/3692_1 /ASSEMBLY_ACC=CAM_ASM_000343 /TAXON_ID=268821 /ORGANISM="Scrippsiella Hangoei, Strain SHTV-5" /LENGTH=33 /DNA_ID= /DNA_START= /DNA_END= /DNA_ORIENTATION=
MRWTPRGAVDNGGRSGAWSSRRRRDCIEHATTA